MWHCSRSYGTARMVLTSRYTITFIWLSMYVVMLAKILIQVASQIIQWLHEEALAVGIKANRDFLSLAFELEQGEIARLVAHVDPDDTQGCISWWLTIDDGLTEEHKLRSDMSYFESQSRKFLGYLPLDLLHSTLLDFLNLCSY